MPAEIVPNKKIDLGKNIENSSGTGFRVLSAEMIFAPNTNIVRKLLAGIVDPILTTTNDDDHDDGSNDNREGGAGGLVSEMVMLRDGDDVMETVD